MNKIGLYIIPFLIFLASVSAVSAYVRGSANYRIESDSINIGGGEYSTSTNYALKDTVGELAAGELSSPSFNLRAGYRQMDENYISMTVPADISLSPSLGGISGGTADGSGDWLIKCDSEAGYTLSLQASTSPALVSGINSIADYETGAAGVPDYDWDLRTADSEFGFSPFNAASAAAKFKNNGSACNQSGGTSNDGKCWYGFSTSTVEIVDKNSRTAVAGETTKINLRAEIKSGAMQAAGAYTASLVVTAVSN